MVEVTALMEIVVEGVAICMCRVTEIEMVAGITFLVIMRIGATTPSAIILAATAAAIIIIA